MEKQNEFAIKILAGINSVFEKGSENLITKEDLLYGDNLTHFFHALAKIAPAMVYGKLTGEEVNSLDFNHIANKLCFQYSTLEKSEY